MRYQADDLRNAGNPFPVMGLNRKYERPLRLLLSTVGASLHQKLCVSPASRYCHLRGRCRGGHSNSGKTIAGLPNLGPMRGLPSLGPYARALMPRSQVADIA
jgi:hypothetical protein